MTMTKIRATPIWKVVPDSLREDFPEQSNGRRGRRELPIDSHPAIVRLLAGKTVFFSEGSPPDEVLGEAVDKAFQKRLYSRFHFAFGRRMHAIWKEYKGDFGVVIWLDPEKRGRKAA